MYGDARLPETIMSPTVWVAAMLNWLCLVYRNQLCHWFCWN